MLTGVGFSLPKAFCVGLKKKPRTEHVTGYLSMRDCM